MRSVSRVTYQIKNYEMDDTATHIDLNNAYLYAYLACNTEWEKTTWEISAYRAGRY
jgi:hypothetical protein